jgi:hypothetical protein
MWNKPTEYEHEFTGWEDWADFEHRQRPEHRGSYRESCGETGRAMWVWVPADG